MLSIAPLRGAAARVEYLFYKGLTAQERQGVWLGSAAAYAGLRPGDRVVPTDLLLCLEGFSPADRARLQHHRQPYPSRLAGWDFTFSVSKSLSLAAHAPGHPLAKDVPAAFDSAIQSLWPVIEHMLAPNSSQVQPDPDRPIPAIGARFMHWRSRYEDPHLHIHLIVPNTCVAQGPDGDPAWRAVDPIRPFLGSQDLDRLVQHEVSRILTEQGYAVEMDVEGRAHLPQVPPDLVQRYSKGRAAILAAEEAEREGRAGLPVARKQARGRSIINQKIRPEKTTRRRVTGLSWDDEQQLKEALRDMRRRRKSRGVHQVSPYLRLEQERERKKKLEAEAQAELAEREYHEAVGREIVARSIRAMASRNRHTPMGALLDAFITLFRLWRMQQQQHHAILGVPSRRERTEHAILCHASRQAVARRYPPTLPDYVHTSESSRSDRTPADAGVSIS